MIDLNTIFRSEVLHLQPYSSARSEYMGKVSIALDANESPYENGINRYPDPKHVALKRKVASWRNVPVDNIIIGNGSDEIIDLLIRGCCTPRQDRILCLDPSYGMYAVTAAISNVEVDSVALTQELRIDIGAVVTTIRPVHKLIFLCSPNNPDGSMLSQRDIEAVLEASTGLVVVDEAYIDFSDQPSAIRLMGDHPRLFVMQTMSKAMGAAGLRIGFGYGHHEVIKTLHKIKPPYNIGSLVQQRACDVLDNIEQITSRITEIKSERDRLSDEVANLPIIEKVYPSQANFILIRCTDSEAVYQYLLAHEVIVRKRSHLLHCEGCLRISIGTPAENNELVRLLQLFCTKK